MNLQLRYEPSGEDVGLFALANGEVAGGAVLCARPVRRLAAAAYPDVPEIGYLHVEPAKRGRGIGTALVEYGERLARERGAPAVTIGVGPDNPWARALYQRLGYRPTGVMDSYEYASPLPDGTTRMIAERAETLRKVLAPVASSRADVVALASRLAAARAGQMRWIGLDGWGAAGKSTLAAAIAAELRDVAVVHIDDFASPRIPEWDWDRFDAQVVAPLLAGQPARYQRWDWATDAGAEWQAIEPGRVVVVEGVSSTRREVRAPWALTVWVAAPRDVRLRRAAERDGTAMLPRWLGDWLPSEEAYVARERPQQRADVVVDGAALWEN